MNNIYATHTLLDLHNSTDHAKPHPTIPKYVIDIPFKDLFLILWAFIRNHLLFCCYIDFRLPRFDSMTNFPSLKHLAALKLKFVNWVSQE